MHVIRLGWHPHDQRVADGIRYIAHREERTGGGVTRPLHGLGPRYRALSRDERAVQRLLWRDGRGFPAARYYRVKLTLNDNAAGALAALPLYQREPALRRAVERALGRALPLAQGVYVTHSHGGRGRPYGHPHAHVHLSPRLDGAGLLRINRARLQVLRRAWEREVDRALTRYRARVQPLRAAPGWAALLGRRPAPSHAQDREVGRQAAGTPQRWP